MSDQSIPAEESRDPEYVYFITESHPEPGQYTEHAALPKFSRKLEEVQRDWTLVIAQASSLVSEHTPQVKGYELEEVEFSLGFSATGQLAFIAAAGTQASIRILFKRAS